MPYFCISDLCTLSCICCHAWQHNMYLLKISFLRITLASLKGLVALYFLLHYFKDNYINNWWTRRFLKCTIEFCVKKENCSHAVFTEKISKNRFHCAFRFWSGFPYRCCSIIRNVFLRHVYVRLPSAAASKDIWPVTFTNTMINHCILFFCPKCNNNNYKYETKQQNRKKENRIYNANYITTSLSSSTWNHCLSVSLPSVTRNFQFKFSWNWCIVHSNVVTKTFFFCK